MKKFKDLSGDLGLIHNINDSRRINGNWINEVDIESLDMYLNLHIGNREIVPSLYEGFTEILTLKYMSNVLSGYAYKLDGLWNSTKFEYDPIMNKDRTFTHTETVVKQYGDIDTQTDYGTRTQTNTMGERENTELIGEREEITSQTIGQRHDTTGETIGSREDSKHDSLGNRSDTHDSSGNTTAFDSSDYGKGTNKITENTGVGSQINDYTTNTGEQENSGSYTQGEQENSGINSVGAQTNVSTLGGSVDTIENSSVTDTVGIRHEDDETSVTITEREFGNIGETTTQSLILEDRNVVNFVFFDAVQEIILHEFAKSFLWDY